MLLLAGHVALVAVVLGLVLLDGGSLAADVALVLAGAAAVGFVVHYLVLEQHEAVHYNLAPSRRANDLVATRTPAPCGTRPDAMTAVDRSGLDPAYFDTMAAHATTHWWYRARSEWVTQELGGRAAGGTALDVGCGVGATLRALRAAGFDTVLGLDVSPYVLQRAREVVPGQPLFAVASAEVLPVADGALSGVASLDVLEHLEDDVAALREYARVVVPGGYLLLMTPAYQWLFSDHDRWANHFRRYSARRLTAAVRAAGLEVERTTYVFSFLVPAAALLRRTPVRRWLGSTDEETSSVSPLLNRLLAFATRLERRVGRVIRIPFGLSVLVVARVPPRR